MESGLKLANPASIEQASMEIITQELDGRGIVFRNELEALVVKRVIHATADFDFAENICFTPDAVETGVRALRGGILITDTRMALAGLSEPALRDLRAEAVCLMADPEVRETARRNHITRAAVAIDCALERYAEPDGNHETRGKRENHGMIWIIGNAPTALFRLAERMVSGFRPALVIAMPVGFVNVIEGKKRIWEVCQAYHIPAIAAMGRKGGSGAAAAACNALLYAAAGLSDPEARNRA